MNITLPLDKMTNEEKLILMEKIWADLDNNTIKSPLWHESILKKRKNTVENGEETILDWDQAKNKIRNNLTEDKNT